MAMWVRPPALAAAAYLARATLDLSRALAFDIGGTTTRTVCLITDSVPETARRGESSAISRCACPTVAVESIGPGRFDPPRSSRWGPRRWSPRSSGAVPDSRLLGLGGTGRP